MSEHKHKTAEILLSNIMETLADSVPRQKSMKFFEEENTVSAKMNRFFGRQKSLHRILGGGKPADVLLWRNKKISLSFLLGATAIWVLFEWLNYHILTLIAFALVFWMIIQFVWSAASGTLKRSPPKLVLPNELFANIAVSLGDQINQFLAFIQDIACRRDMKQFLLVVAMLWAAAIIGSWCNFLTVLYIGFVCAHTIPVFYEKYGDQVDDFLYNVVGNLQNQFNNLDKKVLSKIPKENIKFKKSE